MTTTTAGIDHDVHAPGKAALWTGRVLSTIVILMLVSSGIMKLSGMKQLMEDWSGKFGYSPSSLPVIAVIELAVAVVYAIPRTTVLGAILVTGYLGGAIATHVRIADPAFIPPLVLGVFTWGGLYLRSHRLHGLLPLVK